MRPGTNHSDSARWRIGATKRAHNDPEVRAALIERLGLDPTCTEIVSVTETSVVVEVSSDEVTLDLTA